jgi:lipopolysaccharide export system protein LptA
LPPALDLAFGKELKRVRWIGLRIAVVALCLFCSHAFGQAQGPSDTLAISGDNATNWIDGDTSIIQVQGHVTITTDDATLSADNAVIWIHPYPGAVIGEQLAEIALLGNAKIVHGQATRTNESLYATQEIRGRITFYGERIAHDSSDTDIYKQALSLRPQAPGAPQPPPVITNTWLIEPPSTEPTSQPASRPTTQPSPVYFEAQKLEQTLSTEGKVSYVLTGGVLITQNRIIKAYENVIPTDQNMEDISDHIELRADRAVILTNLDNLRELADTSQFQLAEDIVQGAYLEGDVRIVQTPPRAQRKEKSENRLDCDRAYYEFATERAVLTDAVIHTVEPKLGIPIIVRAGLVRQLSNGEYRAQNAELTTSSFAIPSYSIRASTAYVRQVPTNDPRYGNLTQFKASNATFNLFHVPFFYLPYASGSTTDRGGALRGIEVGSSKNNGFGIRTELGLFESLGILPPDSIDAYYKLDYFTERNFGLGFNAKYEGGFVTENTRQPWDFQGDFKSYFLPDDTGTDKLGKNRRNIDPDNSSFRETARGAFQFQHQHFFPDDWQFQFRFGLVNDPTFLEYWDEGNFNDSLPHDFEAYVKKQHDTEAFTLLVQFQPNDFVTTADQLQNVTPPINGVPDNLQFAKPFEVERVPEVGYYRIGDSFGDDQFTFFSANTASILHYNVSDASLFDYGFKNRNDKKGVTAVTPGLPSIGQTGFTDNHVVRGDFRQEIDYPLQIDKFKVSPYVVGRLTSYSDSVDGGTLNRLYGGAGVRASTAFWKVDDTAQSDLFDIHRLRHVIEPEVNLFAGVENKDRNDVFIYDEPIDQIWDISAVQLALRQRWQTKRGGPGNWRSVDFFALNVELNLFANEPHNDLPPEGFRGLFFNTAPEASIPRNSINTDALWRISDTTVILADLEHNLDEQKCATASVGLAVTRDDRIQYFVGVRYIGELDSTIASFLMNYEISTKYSLLLKYSFNFSENSTDTASVIVTRKFDRFFVTFEYFYDAINNDSGFRFGLFPTGLGGNVNTAQLQNLFGSSK